MKIRLPKQITSGISGKNHVILSLQNVLYATFLALSRYLQARFRNKVLLKVVLYLCRKKSDRPERQRKPSIYTVMRCILTSAFQYLYIKIFEQIFFPHLHLTFKHSLNLKSTPSNDLVCWRCAIFIVSSKPKNYQNIQN